MTGLRVLIGRLLCRRPRRRPPVPPDAAAARVRLERDDARLERHVERIDRDASALEEHRDQNHISQAVEALLNSRRTS